MKTLTILLLTLSVYNAHSEPLGLLDHSWSQDGLTDGFDIQGATQMGYNHFGGDVWVDGQSRTYVSGSYQSEMPGANNGLSFARLMRYTATGQLDTSFNGTGIISFPLPIAISSDNDVFVTGSANNGVFVGYSRLFCPTQDDADCHMDINVHHISSTGSSLGDLTVAFDIGNSFQRNDDHLKDMAFSSALDKLFLAAEIEFTSVNDTDFGIVSIDVNTNGALSMDTSFSTDGKQTCFFDHANAAGSQDQAAAIAVNPFGTVVVGGHAFEANGTNGDGWNQAFCEFDLNGNLLQKWSTQGTGIQLDSREYVSDLAFEQTSLNKTQLYVLGTQNNANTLDATVSRYVLSQLNAWQLDVSFGTNQNGTSALGLNYPTAGDTDDFGSQLQILPGGYILTFGNFSNQSTNETFFSGVFLAMFSPDGQLDKSWGINGITKHIFALTNQWWEHANGMAIDPNTQAIVTTGFHRDDEFKQLTARFHNDRIFSDDFE